MTESINEEHNHSHIDPEDILNASWIRRNQAFADAMFTAFEIDGVEEVLERVHSLSHVFTDALQIEHPHEEVQNLLDVDDEDLCDEHLEAKREQEAVVADLESKLEPVAMDGSLTTDEVVIALDQKRTRSLYPHYNGGAR